MHLGFALELSNVDLWNIDLLDTHLDLLDTDIPSKYFACLHNVFKTSSRHVFKTSSRHVFKTSRKTQNCYAEDVFKANKCLPGCDLRNAMPLHWSPTASHTQLLPRKTDDFPRGGKYPKVMLPSTYSAYFSLKSITW